MTTDSLPAPPLPADADLTHYDDMPLEVRRLRDSGIAGETNAEIFRCAVLLWCVAWHQLPAGSLPKGDDELCRLVGLGRDHKTWRKIKAGVLRGWREFSDGRLYHKVVAEKAIEGWNRSRVKNWAMACDRLRKENKAREERHEPKLAMPQRPTELPLEWPEDIVPLSVGTAERLPTENRLKGIEGKGIEDNRPPFGEAASSVAARVSDAEIDDAFALWITVAYELRIKETGVLTPELRKALAERLAECRGLDGWRHAMDSLRQAEWLRDDRDPSKPKWWVKLKTVLKPDNFNGLMGGDYAERHDRQSAGKPGIADTVANFAEAAARG